MIQGLLGKFDKFGQLNLLACVHVLRLSNDSPHSNGHALFTGTTIAGILYFKNEQLSGKTKKYALTVF